MMKNKRVTIVFCALTAFIVINNLIFIPGNILSYDVFGYYLYLPFKFIYHDLGLHHISVVNAIIEKYHNTDSFYQVLGMPNGNLVMKYSMGLSFFYAPFFFIGHLIAGIIHYPVDGFSAPYQYSIFAGGIIYTIIGIWALTNVLMRFFSKGVVVLVLILIVFSTNYLVHITMFGQNAMSHNYLFTAYALILWLSILWHEKHQMKHAVGLAIICGVTILSRPSEIVCLIIPALWGITDKGFLKERLKLLGQYKNQLAVFALILILIGSCQLIYWKVYTGKFIFNSYGGNAGEGFEFFSPYMLKVLFSFRKGWLVYTPVMLFAITGFYFLFRKNRPVFYAVFIYFIVNLYIVSSWSCWWYAQSFSQRALIPSYPVMAIGLGYFLEWLNQKRILKVSGYILIAGCLFLNIFQTLQFQRGVIDGDRMTAKYYFRVFGKMSASGEDRKLLMINRNFNGTETFTEEDKYSRKLLGKLDFEQSSRRNSTVAHSGKYSCRIDSSDIYAGSVEVAYKNITQKDHAWIRVSAYVYPTKDIIADPFCLVVHFSHHNYPYKYIASGSEKMTMELNHWNKISFDYLTPEVRNKNDRLKVYVWNRGKAVVYIDDLQVDVYEKKE